MALLADRIGPDLLLRRVLIPQFETEFLCVFFAVFSCISDVVHLDLRANTTESKD